MNVNYYNPYVRAELELYHHGVAGQRWGKRHGPPYPLGASQVSAAEKKAGWKKSKFADDKPSVTTKTNIKRKGASSNPVSKMKNAVKKKIDSITPEQKAKMKKYAKRALIVAGAIAITAAAVYFGNKVSLMNIERKIGRLSREVNSAKGKTNSYMLGFNQGKPTGYQRLLNMQDRHPGSHQARRAVRHATKQLNKNLDRQRILARSAAELSGNRTFYSNPAFSRGSKLLYQITRGKRYY